MFYFSDKSGKNIVFYIIDGCKTEGDWIILTHLMVLKCLVMGAFVKTIKNKNEYKSRTCMGAGGGGVCCFLV